MTLNQDNTAAIRILIRATALDARVSAFADQLSDATGYPVAFVIDERRQPAPQSAHPIVGLTDDKCHQLGLYCPGNYAWRCGDYGYFLARRRFPETQFFWMVEYDVRFIPEGLRDFFLFFEQRSTIDFLATNFEKSDWSWYWAATLKSNNTVPFRCLFPITRLSTSAIDAVLKKRVSQSRRLLRKLLWPNDEAMVSTTLANAGFSCRDINSFGRHFYDEKHFSFECPIEGDAFRKIGGNAVVFHPVLYDKQYSLKVSRLKERERPETRLERFARRFLAKANSYFAW